MGERSVMKKYDMEQANRRPGLGRANKYWKTSSHLITNNKSPANINSNERYRKTIEQPHRRSYDVQNSPYLQQITHYSPDGYARSSNSSKNQLSLEKPYDDHETDPQAK